MDLSLLEYSEEYCGAVISGIPYDELDLDKTFNSGQCFRWNKVGHVWIGIIGTEHVQLTTSESYGRHRLVIDKSVAFFKEHMVDYLDLKSNYNSDVDFKSDTFKKSDDYAYQSVMFSGGIRILRQDPWEALISFIISQRNNIPKIKTSIDNLCSACGTELTTLGGTEYYAFPTAEQIVRAGKGVLSHLSLGYRDDYVLQAAQAVVFGQLAIYDLAKAELSSAAKVDILKGLYGVGQKVATCTALYGMHHLDMFPIDVWMQRISDNYYNGNINPRDYGKYAGVMQQYMFYYERNK